METTSIDSNKVLESLHREDRFALQCALASVSDLMTKQVVTLEVHRPLRDAARLFSSGKFHQILILDGPYLAGVLSDRDVLHSSRRDADPTNTTVSAAMTRNPITIRPHASISEAIHLLTSQKIECLPVTGENGVVYGIITKSDLLQVSFVVQRWIETRAPRLHA
jgi:CBS domain-containing protein